MKLDTSALFAPLQQHYSQPEAETAINALLRPFGDGCKIRFRQTDAEVLDAYLVKSKAVRYLVCEIICRTGLSTRSYENLSAEWVLHNISHALHFFPKFSKDVSLDYHKDPRFPVALISDLLDFFNIE